MIYFYNFITIFSSYYLDFYIYFVFLLAYIYMNNNYIDYRKNNIHYQKICFLVSLETELIIVPITGLLVCFIFCKQSIANVFLTLFKLKVNTEASTYLEIIEHQISPSKGGQSKIIKSYFSEFS